MVYRRGPPQRERRGRDRDTHNGGRNSNRTRHDMLKQDKPAARVAPVDRKRMCPFLLRIFHKMGEHHTLEDFQQGTEPQGAELQVYTWSDVTLRELADLVKDVSNEALSPDAKLSFRLIYPGKDGKNVMTDVGEVLSMEKSANDNKLLSSSNFQVGDCLSLAITTKDKDKGDTSP